MSYSPAPARLTVQTRQPSSCSTRPRNHRDWRIPFRRFPRGWLRQRFTGHWLKTQACAIRIASPLLAQFCSAPMSRWSAPRPLLLQETRLRKCTSRRRNRLRLPCGTPRPAVRSQGSRSGTVSAKHRQAASKPVGRLKWWQVGGTLVALGVLAGFLFVLKRTAGPSDSSPAERPEQSVNQQQSAASPSDFMESGSEPAKGSGNGLECIQRCRVETTHHYKDDPSVSLPKKRDPDRAPEDRAEVPAFRRSSQKPRGGSFIDQRVVRRVHWKSFRSSPTCLPVSGLSNWMFPAERSK